MTRLKSSPPVVATQHGQVISNLRITTSEKGVAAITVHAFENVTIQNEQIQYGAHGGSGIAFNAAHGLTTIRNASIALVDASVPTGGPLPTSHALNIRGASTERLVVDAVRLGGASSGIYLPSCPGALLANVQAKTEIALPIIVSR